MKATLLVVIFVTITILSGFVECSKILLVFPTLGKSHYILGTALARGLAEAGHEITMVSPFEEKKPTKKGKYTDVVLTGLHDAHSRDELLELENTNPFARIPFMNYFGIDLIQKTMEHPNFLKLLQSNQTFDAVIVEQFNDDALKIVAHHFKAPLILFSSIGANAWVNPLVGNPSPPSYISEALLPYSHNMDFCQRVTNWVFMLLTELNRHLFFFPEQNKLMHKYFPDAPDLQDLLYNASLVLLNSHESVNQAVPYVPNMIDIGGFHISPPKKLPKNLKEFIESAEHGVIYFSMGSNIIPSLIKKNQKQALLKVFEKLKQKVLWKWDEDTMEGKPDNVMLSKWFPQSDILAHPNTKVFITHGGLLSTTETVYHGVPILAFPIFGDQKMNAARAVGNGYGLSLKFSEITEEKFGAALDELLNNPKYRENVKKRSELMHDRPIKPMDLAVYWIEFVIRHGGAPHLRVAGVDLPWYKYLLLDVISFVLFFSFLVLFIVYKIVGLIRNYTVKAKVKVKAS